MLISTQTMIPLSFKNKALAAAIFAVSTMYFGRKRDDCKLQRLGRTAYSTALGCFRSELSQAFNSMAGQERQKELSVLVSLALMLFECLANGPNEEGFSHHLNGVLDIIKLSGPQSLQSPASTAAYNTIRGIVFSEGLRGRKETFLATDYWTIVPYQFTTKTPRDLLLDITLQIPTLLERSDRLLHRFTERDANEQRHINGQDSQYPRHTETIKFIQDCDCLIHKLSNWIQYMQELEKGPLWWYSGESGSYIGEPTTENRRLLNLECEGSTHQMPTIYFSSPRVPGLVIYYWSGMLELSTSILSVRKHRHSDIFYPMLGELLGGDSPSMSMNIGNVTEIAMNICQTIIHHISFLEGCTMTPVSLKLTQEYFTCILSYDYHGCWGDVSDTVHNHEMARIGLEYCKKGQEILQNARKKSSKYTDIVELE
ncbi:hypothetical protein F5884DRAFT_405452 [Xylogone sp. PMI_703]|nr:hypothetical protein F5884DRAFT_405452 [Xylogone sp. PMI_703]